MKVLNFKHPEEMLKHLDLEIPQTGKNLQTLLDDCHTTLKNQVRTGRMHSVFVFLPYWIFTRWNFSISYLINLKLLARIDLSNKKEQITTSKLQRKEFPSFWWFNPSNYLKKERFSFPAAVKDKLHYSTLSKLLNVTVQILRVDNS